MRQAVYHLNDVTEVERECGICSDALPKISEQNLEEQMDSLWSPCCNKWYENNMCNSSLFANLAPEKIEGMEELVSGRLFTTRMPRDLFTDPMERKDWLRKCTRNNLKVICVLTEPHEFKKYSGIDGLIEFYENECG